MLRGGGTRRASEKTWAEAAVLFAVAAGLLAGLLVLAVAKLELKWVVYFAGGVGFFSLLFMLREKETFLWGMFVLGFQIDVAVRFMHGYSDSGGIEFQFCALLGGVFFLSYLASGEPWQRSLKLLGPVALPLLLLAGCFLLSALTTGEQFIALTAIVVYCQLYFVFFLALNYLHDDRRLALTFKLLMVILLMQSAVYYLQSLLGITFTLTGRVLAETELPRPGGTVGTTPAAFASFIYPLLTGAVAVAVAYPVRSGLRWLAAAAAVAGSLALILTFTRAAWAGYALALMWLVGFAVYYRLMRPRLLLVIVIAAVIAGSMAVPFVLGSRADNPLESAFDERFALMAMALKVIEAHPFTGVGPGAYGVSFKHYLTPDLADRWLFIVHNTYLLFAAELGIMGGVALVLWLGAGIVLGLRLAGDRARPPLNRAFGLGISAGFVALAFEMYWEPLNGLVGMTPILPYWFLLGLLAAQARPGARSGT